MVKIDILTNNGASIASICEEDLADALYEVDKWIFDGSESLDSKDEHSLKVGEQIVPVCATLFHYCFHKNRIDEAVLWEMLTEMKPNFVVKHKITVK